MCILFVNLSREFIIKDMNITDCSDREIVKVLVARNKISQKKLIKMIEEKTNKEIPVKTFSDKLWRNNMRVR
mgnify:CR=1 FL=1